MRLIFLVGSRSLDLPGGGSGPKGCRPCLQIPKTGWWLVHHAVWKYIFS